jgi:MFS family permease
LDPYASFRSRDFRFLLGGNLLSGFGLQMLSVAVSWDLYLQTRSAVVLGNVGFVQVAPFLLFALPAGHFADRHDRRRIMIVTQILLMGSSALLLTTSHSVALIYTCLFLTALSRAFQAPARVASLPNVVPPDLLRNAITWNSSALELATVSGPAIAGVLLASAGSRTVYAVQFVCATLTLICYQFVRLRTAPRSEPKNPPTSEPPAPANDEVVEGIRFVWQDKLILSAISLDLFAVLFGGATALLPIYAVEILHTGARGLGWLRAAPSIGAISMALLQSHSPRARPAGKVLLWAVAGFGGATIIFGFSRFLWLSLVMLAITGACDNISVVLRQSLVQSHTPDWLKGRVLAVQNIFISCSNQLGAVESGWTAAWFGAVTSVVGGGVATILIVTGFAAGAAALRRWRQ